MDLDEVLYEIGIKSTRGIKELQGGLRCFSYLLVDNGKKVLQIYTDDIIYQARKKAYIYEIIERSNRAYIPIPKVIGFEEKEGYSYLITDYIDGDMVSEVYDSESFKLEQISGDLARILSEIHSIDIGTSFGWLGEKELPENQSLEEYLITELERFEEALIEELDSTTLEKVMNVGKEAIGIILKYNINKPVLTWYDINPKNLLVKKHEEGYHISGFIDPGAARFGVREWDLAFIKVNLCKSDEEFEKILKEYIKTGNKVNLEVLNAFIKIVELDDLALQIKDNRVYDIPRNSTFQSILLDLQSKYNSLM